MAISDLALWDWSSKKTPVSKGSTDLHQTLQQNINRLIKEAWGDFGFNKTHPAATHVFGDFSPDIDMIENKNEIIIKAELPGITEKNTEVLVVNGTLTIKGEKREEKKEDKEGIQYSECSYGSFQRNIPISCEVEEDKVEAVYKNGVLTIKIPKSEKAKEQTRKIEIKS
jgi:HSP20 family protein